MTTCSNEHALGHLLETADDPVLRVELKSGDVFLLRSFEVVDASIYDEADRWCASIVEAVSGSNPLFHRLFKPGGLVDVNESDFARIEDAKSGDLLFRAQ